MISKTFFWNHKMDFLIWRIPFFISKMNFWYQKIIYIFWYQKWYQLIIYIFWYQKWMFDIRKSFTFFISGILFIDIRKSFIDIKKCIFWYQIIDFLIKILRFFLYQIIYFQISNIHFFYIRNSDSWYQKVDQKIIFWYQKIQFLISKNHFWGAVLLFIHYFLISKIIILHMKNYDFWYKKIVNK